MQFQMTNGCRNAARGKEQGRQSLKSIKDVAGLHGWHYSLTVANSRAYGGFIGGWYRNEYR